MEDIRNRLAEIHTDLKEIRTDQITLIKQSAQHNEILRTHEMRSLALQAEQKTLGQQIKPIERHVELINTIAKLSGAVLAGILIRLVVSYLLDT